MHLQGRANPPRPYPSRPAARSTSSAWRVAQCDFTNEEAVGYLADRLAKLGVEDKLFKAGAVAGSTVVIGHNVFDWEPTLTSTAELLTSPRGTDARLAPNERPTRNARREAYFERMDAKAAARAELIREREAGIWHDDEGFAVDRTSDTRENGADPDEASTVD